ncbi:MAG: cation diffusion facilitator family transporter [Oscillospiraceae bacterium]|nr:cation diffusion facilitator family transporter [Oscillospiraceae bacterium]
MVTLLSKIFIKNSTDYKNPIVRRAYGTLCSIVGILLNILMFAGKYIAGVISNSVSITADAFNNLSDAASSIITLLGFRFSGKKPDPTHPFGHGRIEYISGLAVSFAILLMGFELLKDSITKIIHPEPVTPSLLAGGIMVAAILIKIYMAVYNSGIGKKIDSATMKSVAADSLSDTASTTVVLVSMIIYHFTNINIDAYAGVLVALLILYTGFTSAKETIAPLLGAAPDAEFVKEIEETVMESPYIVGIHDLIVHDYGPGRLFVSLHAEVPADEDVFLLHDEIDNAEVRLKKRLSCESTIHMDPIATNDEALNAYKSQVGKIIKEYDEILSFHDFRMVPGPTHTNLIFDVVVPANYRKTNELVKEEVQELVQKECKDCFAIIKVEQSYV